MAILQPSVYSTLRSVCEEIFLHRWTENITQVIFISVTVTPPRFNIHGQLSMINSYMAHDLDESEKKTSTVIGDQFNSQNGE